MRFFACGLLLIFLAVSVVHCQESEDIDSQDETWWGRFKQKVKTVLSRWRDDIKLLWDDVLVKADDMRSWTSDMFSSFKRKMREWLESRPNVPDDEKNEIETFISKLKLPTDKPDSRKSSNEAPDDQPDSRKSSNEAQDDQPMKVPKNIDP